MGSFFFGGDKPLSQLLNDHRKTVEKIQEKRRKKNPGKKPVSTTSKPRPTPPKKPVNNPQINGSKKAEHAASKVNYCLSSALEIPSVQDLKNLVFEECIHQQIQDEEDQNEINDYMYDFVNKHNSMHQRWKRYKRQVYQPPQVDEQLVSAFLNSPEAVKMVLSYLDKQKPKTTTTTTTTTKRPPKRNKRPPPRPRPPKRRPPPPPLSFFFGGDKPLSFSTTIEKLWRKSKKRDGRKIQ